MSPKQAVITRVERLPEAATWWDVCNALFEAATAAGERAIASVMYQSQESPEEMVAFFTSTFDVSLSDIVAELTAEADEELLRRCNDAA